MNCIYGMCSLSSESSQVEVIGHIFQRLKLFNALFEDIEARALFHSDKFTQNTCSNVV